MAGELLRVDRNGAVSNVALRDRLRTRFDINAGEVAQEMERAAFHRDTTGMVQIFHAYLAGASKHEQAEYVRKLRAYNRGRTKEKPKKPTMLQTRNTTYRSLDAIALTMDGVRAGLGLQSAEAIAFNGIHRSPQGYIQKEYRRAVGYPFAGRHNQNSTPPPAR